MKIALYVEDGIEQIILTPQSDCEKNILEKIHNSERDMSVKRGSFYEYRGGWTRQGSGDDSTMIVLTKREVPPSGED